VADCGRWLGRGDLEIGGSSFALPVPGTVAKVTLFEHHGGRWLEKGGQ
jgi:hypothetical protein